MKPKTPADIDADQRLTAADHSEVEAYLFSLKSSGVHFGIERMGLFADLLGHPEREVPCVHVTGTNGKGSTCAMIEAILRQAGWRTGLYTSPHLIRLGERIQVDRRIISWPEIAAYSTELKPLAEQVAAHGEDMHPTFFEFMTGMAFQHFKRTGCDFSIIEVGMGGELDATNIVLPEVSVITSISLDHCEMLGDSIAKIARTKAGIIKPGKPVVLGRLPPEAEKIIREIAAARGSDVHSVREVFGDDSAAYPATNLEGEYQRWNAATATLAARVLGARWRVDEAAIAQGLSSVSWPGRWQSLRLGGKAVILDASHNTEGADVLELNLARLVQSTGRKPVVVTGVLGSSRASAVLRTICAHASEVHLVVPQQARACSHAELQSLLPSSFTGRVHLNTVEAVFPGPDTCLVGTPDDVIVVTGSIYLLGEVLTRLEPAQVRGEGRLQDF